MNEITEQFDYSILDVQTKEFLEEKALIITGIQSKSAFDIGKQLLQAQEKLAKNGYGNFEEWYRSLGFKKTRAYEYINHYNFVRSQNEQSKIEKFNDFPKSLQAQVAKPSANEQVNEAVFNGDISSAKEYKELERQLKQRDDELADRDKRINQLSKAFQDISAKEPKVIEKQIEVVPTDYESTKLENEKLVERNSALQQDYQKLLMERKEADEKSEKYEQLSKAIKSAEGELSKQQKLIADYKKLSDLLEKSNDFLGKASALVYLDLSEVVNSDGLARRELNFLIERLDKFLSELTKLTQTDYIEGEIING